MRVISILVVRRTSHNIHVTPKGKLRPCILHHCIKIGLPTSQVQLNVSHLTIKAFTHTMKACQSQCRIVPDKWFEEHASPWICNNYKSYRNVRWRKQVLPKAKDPLSLIEGAVSDRTQNPAFIPCHVDGKPNPTGALVKRFNVYKYKKYGIGHYVAQGDNNSRKAGKKGKYNWEWINLPPHLNWYVNERFPLGGACRRSNTASTKELGAADSAPVWLCIRGWYNLKQMGQI